MKRQLAALFLSYLRVIAQLQLKKFTPVIIGITGTAGKTSALSACEAVLKNHFKLKVSHKANSESGIPLNILGLQLHNYSVAEWLRVAVAAPLQLLFNWQKYDIYLVEMGIDGPDEPKNMTYLLKIVQPKVGIFLNAAPNHTEPFDHLVTATTDAERRAQLVKLIAAEKGKLITSLPKGGTAILNADDESVRQFEKKTKASVLLFGNKADATVQIISHSTEKNSTQCVVKYNDKSKKLFISGYLLPKHYSTTIAAAICCGLSQNLSFEDAIRSIETNFKLPPGRSSLIPAINGAYILDSSYNASTQPVLDMLQLLHDTPARKHYALLGDLRELGEVSQMEHETIAKAASKLCDEVFLVGPLMQAYALPLLKKSKTPALWFATAQEAAQHLKTVLKKDDLLLVKASQNTLLLESAVELLMANSADADSLLCRRGAYWDAQRAAIAQQ